jgi:hypothetical protein
VLLDYPLGAEYNDEKKSNSLATGVLNHQKNWMPMEVNSSIYFVRSIEPLHIVEVATIDANNTGA